MKTNSLIYSSSGNYAVEIKQEDLKSNTISTVYYKRKKVGLQQFRAELADTWESVKNFLEKN